MSYLTNEDKKARCLVGFPVIINGINLYPLKVEDAILAGEQNYNYHLLIITMLKKMLDGLDEVNADKLEEMETFDLLLILIQFKPHFLEDVIKAFQFFLPNMEIVFNAEQESFLVSSKEDIIGSIDRTCYNDFIEIIKMQNYLRRWQDQEPEAATESARKLQEQRRKARDEVARAKGEKGEPLSLADYLSVINSKSLNLSSSNLLGMTMYAFFDYLERLTLIDNYDVSIKQILAGVDPNKLKFKHWITKL